MVLMTGTPEEQSETTKLYLLDRECTERIKTPFRIFDSQNAMADSIIAGAPTPELRRFVAWRDAHRKVFDEKRMRVRAGEPLDLETGWPDIKDYPLAAADSPQSR
jgi:hypothetical protein